MIRSSLVPLTITVPIDGHTSESSQTPGSHQFEEGNEVESPGVKQKGLLPARYRLGAQPMHGHANQDLPREVDNRR